MSDDPGLHLTLVVPGLLGPAPAGSGRDEKAFRMLTEGLALPALERFFSRAREIPAEAREPELAATLFGCFRVAKSGPDWPVAAVTRALDGGGEDARWVLRADPVHLAAGMGELVLTDGTDLSLSEGEAEALAAEINAQVDDPGLRLEPLTAGRWYLSLAEAPRLITQSPWEVAGAPIGEHLPAGEDAGRFRALVNDIQMILHASPVNRAREQRGEPAINSVWPWGGGHLPRVPAPCWQGVWTDEAPVEGLAKLGRMPSHPLPADARAWLGKGPSPGRHLLVLGAGYIAARCSDVDTWRRFVAVVEAEWLAPLLDALAAGRLQSIEVRTQRAGGFRLCRRQLRYWWRQRAPFARVMASHH